MPITKVQFGNVYNVRAIQNAQARQSQHAYTTDAVKERELHPDVKNEVLANKLDYLA